MFAVMFQNVSAYFFLKVQINKKVCILYYMTSLINIIYILLQSGLQRMFCLYLYLISLPVKCVIAEFKLLHKWKKTIKVGFFLLLFVCFLTSRVDLPVCHPKNYTECKEEIRTAGDNHLFYLQDVPVLLLFA